MPYLRGEEEVSEGCIFCAKPQEDDAEVHILHRGQLCYVILNRFPYSNGHLMVVPYVHVHSLEGLDAETLAELMALTQLSLRVLRLVCDPQHTQALTQLSLRVLRVAYEPQGFNVGVNIGAAGGAGVAEHVHLHVVPRWGGDTNYMTVVSQTRLIPEWLDQTYDRLRLLFERMMSG